VASVREDPTDHPPPPARLNRSVDFELGGRGTSEDTAAPTAAASQPSSRSFLGRSGMLSCRVLLLDGDEITVEVEVVHLWGVSRKLTIRGSVSVSHAP